MKGRCEKFEEKYSFLTNEIIRQEAADIVLSSLREKGKSTIDGEELEKKWPVVKKRLGIVFKKGFLYNFRKNNLKLTKSGRGMEISRSRKLQPEIVLDWFRLYLHACALRQIQVP